MNEHYMKIGEAHVLHQDMSAHAAEYLLARDEEMSDEALRRFAADLMNTIAGSCFRSGAKVIGHIKAYIENEKGFLHASTVGSPDDVTVSGPGMLPFRRAVLVVNAVVYGMEQEAVQRATERAIGSVCDRYGFVKGPVLAAESKKT